MFMVKYKISLKIFKIYFIFLYTANRLTNSTITMITKINLPMKMVIIFLFIAIQMCEHRYISKYIYIYLDIYIMKFKAPAPC